MNEAQVRERLRKAVGEADYPAYMSSRIEAGLKPGATRRGTRAIRRPGQGPWRVSFGRAGSLLAALLVVLLMASLVLGIRVLLTPARPAPAGPQLTIKQYQAMVHADDVAFQITQVNHCATIEDTGCPAAAEVVITALQQWLDDLNRVVPPARFSTVDALMHRHLTLIIPDHYAIIAAFSARDSVGFQAALDAAGNEKALLETESFDVAASSQGTIGTYTASVRAESASLLACVLCQRLVSDTQLSCRATQTPSCVDELAAFRLQVETFQGDLIGSFAPNALAGKDGLLQADLLSADVALDSMESALSAGDQPALQGGGSALRKALVRIESDAAGIVKGA
jgi:hypothetical protein